MKLSKYQFFVALHKFIEEDRLVNFFNNPESQNSFYTLGLNDDLEKLDRIKASSKYLNKINLDVANGYMYSFLDYIKKTRQRYPNFIIMAGNVATPEGVENIIKAGADIAKCGIANGCKSPADICKALGSGSHFVMAGGLFAGTDECESEWKEENDSKKMLMYGMSSKVANDKYCGGLKSYRASEGRESWVDYKGPVEDIAIDIRGGVASCCTYTNTKNLENLKKNCVFTISR